MSAPTPILSDLIDELARELRRYTLRRGRTSNEEAADLVQHVFLDLLKLRSLPATREEVRRLAFKMAHRRYVDFVRAGAVRARPLSLPPPGTRDPEKWIMLEQIFSALEDHNPTWADVLRLQVLHGMECEAIAETTGMHPDTVRSNLARARQWLRNRFPDVP